jgi:general secretion pathway protein K
MDPARRARLGAPGAAPGRQRQQTYTTLDAVWNTPLAETRLDQYIERERVQGEVFDATLSGNIIDATARYNLLNLAPNRGAGQAQLAHFRRLLKNLQLDPALAEKAALAVARCCSRAVPPAEVPQGDGSGAPRCSGSRAACRSK